MFNRIHQKLGTAGFIISIVALVAALGGGAYAANSALSGKQKKEVEKIAKKYAGKPGAPGAAGPAGPAGSKGDAGAAGTNGTNGTAGTNGTSVTNTAVPTGNAKCEERGGTEFKVGGAATFACNGQTGFTETLPSEKTETGTWAASSIVTISGHAPESLNAQVPISFSIPLESALDENHVKIASTDTTDCPGSAAVPLAKAGFLCVYVGGEEGTVFISPPHKADNGNFEGGADTSGAIMTVEFEGGSFANGTWAVTAQ
jgi:hypothetical protein